MEEDWDNLIILDGCRFDMFDELSYLSGTLERRVSQASATPKFLERNFRNGPYHDTIYITANPMYRRPEVTIDLGEKFFDIVDVWEGGWDSDLNTVTPGVMVEAVLETCQENPTKRILAHFVQPHHPFIGEFGMTLHDTGMTGMGYRSESNEAHEKIWDKLRKGEVSVETVKQAYWENLELLFPFLETLLNEIPGRTIVTSDHGNLLGERVTPLPFREFGHPSDVYARELIDIPWLVIDDGDRRTINASSPTESGEKDITCAAERRLEDLGYI